MSPGPKCPPVDQGGPIDRPFELFPYSALDGSIGDRFDATARRFSERKAVSDCVGQLSYADLAVVVDRIANTVAAAVAERPGPVAILLSRDLLFPAAMLAVLAAGRGFVPLDAGDPIERIRRIATTSGAAALVTTPDLARGLGAMFPPDLPVIDIETTDGAACGHPIARPAPDDLAFIVYTSGSTGNPKGAYHNHRNLLHDVMQQTNTLHLNEDDRVALLYSPAVIAAIREIFMTLLNGASLHILPPQELQSAGLVREIGKRGITVCRTVPVLLRRMTEALGPNERLDGVRVVGLGSQRVDWSDFDVFRRHFPAEALLIVGIGATECGGNYAHWFVDDRLRATGPRLPIGRILPDANVTIARSDGRPVDVGEVGEFIVASRYVALGYWRDPEMTARAFTIHPADPKTRIFKTGDIGRLRPDGLLEYVGRSDQQIKLRGHRIEIGEIEIALGECAGVEDAAVVARRDEAGLVRSLAAYVEPRIGVDGLQAPNLLSILADRLPGYMIPATLHIAEKLPRLPNLKIDRVRLNELDAATHSERRERASVRNRGIADGRLPNDRSLAPDALGPLYLQILDIWRRIFGRDDIAIDDNFFELGGDSLSATQMICEVEAVTRQRIPRSALRTTFTIRELAVTLLRNVPAMEELVTCAKQGRGAAFLFCHGDYMTRGLYALKLADMLIGDQSVYLVHPHLDPDPGLTVEEMARARLPQILAAHPTGIFRLGGHCNGGALALEIAYRLERLGREVEFVALIDVPSLNARSALRAAARLIRFAVAVTPKMIGDRLVRDGMSYTRWNEPSTRYSYALRNYIPPKLRARLICIVCEESRAKEEFSTEPWNNLASDTRCEFVAGTHIGCITTHIGEVARLLQPPAVRSTRQAPSSPDSAAHGARAGL